LNDLHVRYRLRIPLERYQVADSHATRLCQTRCPHGALGLPIGVRIPWNARPISLTIVLNRLFMNVRIYQLIPLLQLEDLMLRNSVATMGVSRQMACSIRIRIVNGIMTLTKRPKLALQNSVIPPLGPPSPMRNATKPILPNFTAQHQPIHPLRETHHQRPRHVHRRLPPLSPLLPFSRRPPPSPPSEP